MHGKYMIDLRLKVIGSSMHPLIENQNEILIRKQKKYRIGDVVAYWKTKSEISVHRIVYKKNGMFYTKGDANRFVDILSTSQSQIIGRYFCAKKPQKALYNFWMILKCKIGIYRLKHFQGGKLKHIEKDKISLRRIEK